MSDFYHTLDEKQLYKLKGEFFPGSDHLYVEMTDDGQPWARLRNAITSQLQLFREDGTEIDRAAMGKHGTRLRFTGLPERFTMKLGSEKIGEYAREGDGYKEIRTRKLTVDETRIMGTFHDGHAKPYHQPDDAEFVTLARTAVTTDLHTHSSGQISAEGLIGIAEKHALHYPIHLLVEAGILTQEQCHENRFKPWGRETRVKFPPLEPQSMLPSEAWAFHPTDEDLHKGLMPAEVATVPVSALSDVERAKLAQMMCLSADRQNTHTEMEYNAYRYRYPIAKKPEVLEDNLRAVAAEYAEQGINYAEISYVGLDNPALLETLHRLVPEIEAETGVKLRFMVGIPRDWPIETIQNTLTKTRALAKSPYITGVDFLGYEVNKTDRFTDVLEDFAKWANENAHGFTIRAHAGENDKNPENIKQLLLLMKKYQNLRTRIGHGLYGLDADTLALAKEMDTDPENPRLVIEYNPSSNIALNNIDTPEQVPYNIALEHNLPFVIGSDSSGIYQTTAAQLGLAAMYGGLDRHGFETLARHQEAIKGAQLRTSKDRASLIEGWDTAEGKANFVTQLKAELNVLKQLDTPAPEKPKYEAEIAQLRSIGKLINAREEQAQALGDRIPIGLVGASGSSWDRMDPAARQSHKVAVDMLTQVIDPAKAYILKGRPKNSGLSKLVTESTQAANDNNSTPIKSLGLVAKPEYGREGTFDNIDHLITIDELMDVPDAIVDHVVDRNGAIICIGGAIFTRNTITKADYKITETDRGVMMLLNSGEGAAADKAKLLDPHYSVSDGKELVTNLFNLYGREMFKEGFDPLAPGVLDTLEQEATARVANYQVDGPAANDQRVKGGLTVEPPEQARLIG